MSDDTGQVKVPQSNLAGQCNIGNTTDGFCISTYDLCHSHDDHMDHRQAMMTSVAPEHVSEGKGEFISDTFQK